MRRFLETVTGFPTFLFTVPLVTVAGFWVLVLVGAASARAFDRDADLGALGLGGVPVAVAFTLWTGIAWCGSLGAALLLRPMPSAWPSGPLTGLVVLVSAAVVSWCATRALIRLLRRRHPHEPAPSSAPRPVPLRAAREGRADDGSLPDAPPAPGLPLRRQHAA